VSISTCVVVDLHALQCSISSVVSHRPCIRLCRHVKLMRITIREDFSMTMADQVIQKLNESVEWLDNHFTMSKDDLNELAGKTMGRAFSRLDSKVLGSFSDLIRPC